MKHPHLISETRTVLGKKVKKLRREGFLPANVYGKGLKSHPIQVKIADFEKIHKEVGETGLVDLQFDGKSKPVLIKSLQMNYASHTPLHVDFFQVNLKEKVKAVIAVVLVGEAKAVTDKVGLLLQSLSEVEVEALPDKLPENIEVNIEHLAEIGDQITVGDLKVTEDVTILTDPAQTVAKVSEPTVEEAEPEAPAEGAEGEAAEGEKTEGESKEESGGEKTTNSSAEEKKE